MKVSIGVQGHSVQWFSPLRQKMGVWARSSQNLKGFCYLTMTSSFKSNFVRVCLDYMIGVYGGTIYPKTCILMTATGIAALGRVLLTSLISEKENIKYFLY